MAEVRGFHVAGYIREEMAARGWSEQDVALRMAARENYGIAKLSLELLLHAAESETGAWIGRGMAEELAFAFGTSPELFLNLDREWHTANGVIDVPEFAK